MNVFNRHQFVYMEEEPGDGEGGGSGEGGEGDKGGEGGEKDKSLLGGDNELADGEYYLSDGVKGAGDIPEWYQGTKYKSIAEQAKGYGELEKKFGSFTGTPKDGYTPPEGIEKDDALFVELVKFATDSNMSQEGLGQAWELLTNQESVNADINEEAELAKLGDNAATRMKNVETALRFKAGDKYDEIRDMVTTAEGVILAEAMIKLYSPTKLPKDGGDNPEGLTWELIEKEMYKKDPQGGLLRSSDPNHEKKVQAMLKKWGGDQPDVVTVG